MSDPTAMPDSPQSAECFAEARAGTHASLCVLAALCAGDMRFLNFFLILGREVAFCAPYACVLMLSHDQRAPLTAHTNRPQTHTHAHTHISELQLLSSKRAPADKLQLVVNCCHAIFRACTSPIGADEFLPLLIYVVIGANPARLYSNLQYISRYCNPSRLMAGEGGYFFTNLVCGVPHALASFAGHLWCFRLLCRSSKAGLDRVRSAGLLVAVATACLLSVQGISGVNVSFSFAPFRLYGDSIACSLPTQLLLLILPPDAVLRGGVH